MTKTDRIIRVFCVDTNIPSYSPGFIYLARESNGEIIMPNAYGLGYDKFPCDAQGCYGKHGTWFMEVWGEVGR